MNEQKIIEAATKPKYEIYCDLDGVLCDLEAHFKAVTGQVFEPDRRPNQWNMYNKLPKEFWSDMPWTVDGKELWKFLIPYKPKILTAAGSRDRDRIWAGKREWCTKNLGSRVDVIITERSSLKYVVAKPGRILVDDMESNIKQWNQHDGIGIFHVSAKMSIAKLKKILI